MLDTINIKEVNKEQRNASLIEKLLTVWHESVSASHDFLTPQDIEHISPQAKEALLFIDTLLVAYDNATPVGFMGVQDRKIEMLFLSPQYFGKGLGKKFINIAFDKLNAAYVDVNEQNTNAKEFYEHMGFRTFKRNEYDAQGNHFPILEMKI